MTWLFLTDVITEKVIFRRLAVALITFSRKSVDANNKWILFNQCIEFRTQGGLIKFGVLDFQKKARRKFLVVSRILSKNNNRMFRFFISLCYHYFKTLFLLQIAIADIKGMYDKDYCFKIVEANVKKFRKPACLEVIFSLLKIPVTIHFCLLCAFFFCTLQSIFYMIDCIININHYTEYPIKIQI